jgi:ABC-type transport system involved in multi-copper enzyme maturation permease subunit
MTSTRAWLTVFRASFLQTARSRGVWVMVATCVLSSFASIFHNHQGHLEALDQYAVQLQERQRLQFQSPVGPSDRTTDRTLRVLRPPSPAATFVVGVERTLPAAWDFGPAGAETLAPYAGPETLGIFDVLTDGESVVRLFGGMLAIGLGFWVVTRDRRLGWLAAAPWLPAPRWWVMSALLLAGAAVLGVITFVWIGASVTFALWLMDPAAHVTIVFAETWLFVWLYLVTMFGTGALIARLTAHALAGMAAVVATWTVLIFLGPQLVATVSRVVSPPSTRVRLELERRENYADRQKTADDVIAADLAVFSTPGIERMALSRLLADNFPRFEPTWRQAMQSAREESDTANRIWLEARARWVGRLQVLARLTPGTLLQSSLATANGQGWGTTRLWEESITRHEAALNRALFDDRSQLTLRVRWNDNSTLWAHIWHPARSHAELPQFDVAATVASSDRSALPMDLSAGILQVVLVLLAAAVVRPRS